MEDSEEAFICDSADAIVFGGPVIGYGLLSPVTALVFSSRHGIFCVKAQQSSANQT